MLLASIPGVECTENVPLSTLTRFAIGGPALILADASTEDALVAAASTHDKFALIGGGSNLADLNASPLNAWCTPKHILNAHPTDQRPQFRIDWRPASS